MQYALYVLYSIGWMNPFLANVNVVICVKMDFGQMWKKKNRRHTKIFRRISQEKKEER